MDKNYRKYLEQKQRRKERRNHSAEALRAAGYVPIPRWWVRRDELEVIHRMAHNHQEDVNRIRGEAIRKKEAYDEGPE